MKETTARTKTAFLREMVARVLRERINGYYQGNPSNLCRMAESFGLALSRQTLNNWLSKKTTPSISLLELFSYKLFVQKSSGSLNPDRQSDVLDLFNTISLVLCLLNNNVQENADPK